jgi:hypothetical protein
MFIPGPGLGSKCMGLKSSETGTFELVSSAKLEICKDKIAQIMKRDFKLISSLKS